MCVIMIIVCGSWSPLQLPEWPRVGTRRGAFAMGVLFVRWEWGFGPAVSIHVVALAKAKGSATFGGNS